MCVQQEAEHAGNSRLDGYTHGTYVSESSIVTHSCHKISDQKQLKEGFIWLTVKRGAFYHGGQEREVTVPVKLAVM